MDSITTKLINYCVFDEFGGVVILRLINIQLLYLLRRGYKINAFHIWKDLPTEKPDHSFSAGGGALAVWQKLSGLAKIPH